MTLLTGLTAQGVEVPVRVDAEGRLVAKAAPFGVLPPGGTPGQILGKIGEDDFDAEWIDDAPGAQGGKAFGLRSTQLLFIPAGAAPTPLLYPGLSRLLNGATFDAATGRITPTVAGFWWITATIRLGSSITAAKLRLKFNDSDVGSDTKTVTAGVSPMLLAAHYFGLFNGTTDSLLAEVSHSDAGQKTMDQSQICGTLLPSP